MNRNLLWKGDTIANLLKRDIHDLDADSLHHFYPNIGVNPYRPLMIWFYDNPIAGQYYSVDKIKGFRVYNKEAISFNEDGVLVLSNKPKVSGVNNSILSKELRNYGTLYIKMKWSGNPETGVREGIGFADTGWMDAVCLEMRDSNFQLVTKRGYEYTIKSISWNNDYALNYHDYYFEWTPYDVTLRIDGEIKGSISTTIPYYPLDIGIFNWSNESLTRNLEIVAIEYYPYKLDSIPTVKRLLNNLPIRNNTWDSTDKIICRAKNITIGIYNTLNQPCEIVVNGSDEYDFSCYYELERVTVDSGSREVISLSNKWMPYIQISYHCSVAPTEGGLTITVTEV